jgi:AcrR family transcriptional regulator
MPMPKVSLVYEQTQKKRILEGAAKVFASDGYRQTTMGQICHILQLSKGAIYIYFKNKEELFVSTLRSIYEQRYILLSSAYVETDPLSVKFEKILDRLGSLVGRDDYIYMRLSVEGFLESERIPDLQLIKTEYYNRFYKLLYDLLAQGQSIGQINPDLDISSIITILMATLDGLMLHGLVQGRGIDPERIRIIIFETFSQVLKIRPINI